MTVRNKTFPRGSDAFHRQLATVFGLGRFPVAPGTAGSAAGLLLAFILKDHKALYIISFIILFAGGVWSSGKVEKEEGIKDPSLVIIDEFACVFPAFFLLPFNAYVLVCGFVIYRLFDIVKVPPMRGLESLPGGWGIMLDDLFAGIYTNLSLRFLLLIFTHIHSG